MAKCHTQVLTGCQHKQTLPMRLLPTQSLRRLSVDCNSTEFKTYPKQKMAALGSERDHQQTFTGPKMDFHCPTTKEVQNIIQNFHTITRNPDSMQTKVKTFLHGTIRRQWCSRNKEMEASTQTIFAPETLNIQRLIELSILWHKNVATKTK